MPASYPPPGDSYSGGVPGNSDSAGIFRLIIYTGTNSEARPSDTTSEYLRQDPIMTIFKEKVDEEYLTVAETKEILERLEVERATDDEREMRYELARAIEHTNRFAELDPDDAREFADKLVDLEKVDEKTANKIVDLKPRDRDELRAVFAQERYSLSGDELDEILNVVNQYV
ncbi:DNA-directed RNA polymerase, subunit F [Halovenus aranensis]|uniref:DNA-directed RNA polymerase subunit Rpo4 n=2 Tax=Halovenus aranensis TaxID=890420 RepID=A0A1G8W5D1_9EURY|nr:DNA-directed RNA polymerase, subunit F [Halovenus aranensis]